MIIVKLLRRNQTTGGIVLPSNSADPQGYGEILSIGPEIPKFDEPEKNIKEGDKIVFHIRAGMDMVMEKEILRCLKYNEVYGILTNEDAMKLCAVGPNTRASGVKKDVRVDTSYFASFSIC